MIFKLPYIAPTDPVFLIPIRVRWAIVMPKEQPFTAQAPGTPEPDFFINPNPSTIQAEPGPAGTGGHFSLFNRKINREAFGVYREGQFILNNPPSARQGTTGFEKHGLGTRKLLSFYVPINKQIRFANNTTDTANTSPEQNMWFVWWYARDCELASSSASFTTGNGAIEDTIEKTTYFKNSKAYD